ncbi:hypothetical protein P7C71_g6577, partial [Lecanoromycetidae sp. Uapishka_2]
MPRKAFVADLSEAVATFERNNITNFRGGDEDGQINFLYQQDQIGGGTEVTVLVPDVGDYPTSHMYMFYTDSNNVSQEVHSALESMSECSGMKVVDMMAKLVKSLDKATAGSRHNPVDVDDPDPMMIDSDQVDHASVEIGYQMQGSAAIF